MPRAPTVLSIESVPKAVKSKMMVISVVCNSQASQKHKVGVSSGKQKVNSQPRWPVALPRPPLIGNYLSTSIVVSVLVSRGTILSPELPQDEDRTPLKRFPLSLLYN